MDHSPVITYRPIGVIHTPFTERAGMPIQAARSEAVGYVEVYPQYRPALADLDGFSHIFLVYHFHRADPPQLSVRPFLDDTSHGLFATRHPHRPNPIGLSVVRLDRVALDNPPVLHVTGVDMLDGTPLLDIKPYVPQFDAHEAPHTGWIGAQGDRLANRAWRARFDAGADR
ncbi:MAG: tRNA (N6-threonylcarbamoyladenosine(37)-N6)-methyltransferase TrmO [Anaerolineae bacterium]|nr:tRNA (N6-threonylcarbamoyladenosine(37)-N6)-methyltransferase TrmO [Anaerolineae bacterium]